MGRRKIALDPTEVERLAAQGLAEYQIAEALGISQDTLDRRLWLWRTLEYLSNHALEIQD